MPGLLQHVRTSTLDGLRPVPLGMPACGRTRARAHRLRNQALASEARLPCGLTSALWSLTSYSLAVFASRPQYHGLQPRADRCHLQRLLDGALPADRRQGAPYRGMLVPQEGRVNLFATTACVWRPITLGCAERLTSDVRLAAPSLLFCSPSPKVC